MNTQSLTTHPGVAAASLKTLRAGHVMALGSAGGRLDVLHGRVWLTREGDLDDHVVASGESFRVAPNGRALIEAWDDEAPVLVAWRPGTLLDRLSAWAMAASALLHNTAGISSRVGAAAHDREGIPFDAASATPGRARFAAQEARRHPAIPA